MFQAYRGPENFVELRIAKHNNYWYGYQIFLQYCGKEYPNQIQENYQ